MSNGGVLVITKDQSGNNHSDLILGNDEVLCSYSDPTGSIWLGTSNGLYRFTKASLNMGLYNFPAYNNNTHQRNELLNILKQIEPCLSALPAVVFYNTANQWKNVAWNDNVLTRDTWNVRHTHADSFWIATQAGIYCWCMHTDQYRIVQWPKEYSWINTIAVTTQFTDSHQLLWMGLGMGNGVMALQYNYWFYQALQRRIEPNISFAIPHSYWRGRIWEYLDGEFTRYRSLLLEQER